jgi:hypothetical protein
VNTKPYANRLTHVSGAQMELFDEKSRGQKSDDRVPLIKKISKRSIYCILNKKSDVALLLKKQDMRI